MALTDTCAGTGFKVSFLGKQKCPFCERVVPSYLVPGGGYALAMHEPFARETPPADPDRHAADLRFGAAKR